MKFYFFFFTLLIFANGSAQNVGIGTKDPFNKLQVEGNIVVVAPTKSTGANPTGAQTQTMINGSTIFFGPLDSTGRIYDPGGPAGNYFPNLNCTAHLFDMAANTIGFEITIESVQLGTGDSLIFEGDLNSSLQVLLAVGNNYTTAGKWVFNCTELFIKFKSNADASTGSGFSILFKRQYDNSEILPEITGYSGKTFLFDAKKGALRTGVLSNHKAGLYSIGTGYLTNPEGNYSTAFGAFSKATGFASVGMGFQSSATGESSFTAGNNTEANGDKSTSLGQSTLANGFAGTAIGMYNNPILTSPQTSATALTPMFIIGNGNSVATRSNALVVLKNGNIGIGNDAPGFPLNFASTTGDKISLWGNTGNHYGFGIQGNLMQIHTDAAASDVAFGYGSSAAFTETMRIKGNGNMGIGTNNPSQKLHVIGNILASGTITPSDLRYKKNIQPIPNSLQKLLLLNGVSYNMRQEEFPEWQFDDKKQYGLIAQEVEKLFPEMVKTIDPTNGYKGVDYVKLIPVLIEAIKQLQQQIEELRNSKK